MSQGRPASRARTVAWLVVAVVVVPALAYALGLPVEQALLVAVAGAVIAALLRHLPGADDPGWPEPPEADRDRGARREVARLSWRSGTDDAVPRTGLRRVREVAAHRLRRSGLDLDDPADRSAVVALLGERPYVVLTDSAAGGPSDELSPWAFRQAMAAVEALDPDPPVSSRGAP